METTAVSHRRLAPSHSHTVALQTKADRIPSSVLEPPSQKIDSGVFSLMEQREND